jgi:hypothetical protein
MGYIGQTPTAVPLDADDLADGIISEAKLGTDAVSLAKMKAGTDGNIISYDASGNPVAVATGNDGQVLTSTGAGSPPAFEAISAGFTLGTEQSTSSGTGVTFGSIPAGTKQIIVMFEGVSLDGSSAISTQIGDAGGIETSSYSSTRALIAHNVAVVAGGASSGFDLLLNASGTTCTGHMTLTLKDSANFTWVGEGLGNIGSPSGVTAGGGVKSLSAELTQVKVMPLSGNFDAGSVNIMYQ